MARESRENDKRPAVVTVRAFFYAHRQGQALPQAAGREVPHLAKKPFEVKGFSL